MIGGGVIGLSAVGLASLAGSLHCVVMCGPLMALHLHAPAPAPLRSELAAPASLRSGWRNLGLHHLGRAAGYTVLGGLAGAAGRLVDLAGAALAVQRAAMLLAVAALAGWGAMMLVRLLRRRAVRAGADLVQPILLGPSPPRPPSWLGRGLVQLRRRPTPSRAFGLGLLNALLPCGWLWAFVALAASTGSPWTGAATMLVFWLGTLPALFGATALAAPLLSRLRPRWPLVTAGLMLGLAGTALLLRLPLLSSSPGQAPACHDGAAPRQAPASSTEPSP
jgi:uncharacterized protein